MTRWLIAALITIAGASVAWLVIRDRPAPEPPPSAAPASAPAPVDPAPQPANPATLRQPVETPTLDAARSESIDLLVVDRQDQRPVPGAEVWIVESAAVAAASAASESVQRDEESWIRANGLHRRADSEGRLRTSIPPQPARVIARAGERFGENWLSAERLARPGPLRIELEIDRLLRIRAIGPDGEGVPELDLCAWFWQRSHEGVARQPAWLGRTGVGGALVVTHAQRWFTGAIEDPDHGVRRAELRIRSPGFEDAAGLPFVLDPWPAGELTLQVPASGSVVVEVTGELPQRPEVQLAPTGPGAANRVTAALGTDRRARFRQVALGRRFIAQLERHPSVSIEFDGPTRAGQAIETVLAIREARPFLTLRLIDEHGSPLARAQASVRVRHERIEGNFGCRSDAEGRVEVPLSDVPRRQMLVSVEVRTAPGERDPPRLGALQVGREPAPGRNDLGDLVLRAPPLLAAGRVHGIDPALLREAGGFVEIPREHGTPWRAIAIDGFAASADGTFRVHGTTAASLARLQIVGPGITPHAPVEFVPGAADLELTLAAPGAVELPILLDDGLTTADLRAMLAPLDGQALPTRPPPQIQRHDGPIPLAGWSRPTELRGDADPNRADMLRWRGLAAGRHRLEICAGFQPTAVVPALEPVVEPGRTTQLAALDLRGRLRRIRLELRDASGARLSAESEPTVLLHPTEASRPWRGARAPNGVVELIVAGPSDLTILAHGFRRVDLANVHEDRVVRLDPGPRVHVRFERAVSSQATGDDGPVAMLLPDRAAADPARYETATDRGPLASLGRLLPRLGVPIPASGEVTWQVSSPGRYRLRVLAGRRTPIDAAEPTPATLDVTDAPEQEFRVTLR